MAVMKQNRFWFRGVGGVRSRGRVFGWRCVRRTRRGFLRGLVLDGGGVVLGRVPDVLGRVVVGRVRRQENRGDALQQPAGLVEAGQRFRVVGSGVVRDDRDLAGLGFALESFQREDRLLGVLVALDRVQFDFFAGRGEGAEEGLGRLLPVHGRSGALSFRGCMRRVQASCSKRTSPTAYTSQP